MEISWIANGSWVNQSANTHTNTRDANGIERSKKKLYVYYTVLFLLLFINTLKIFFVNTYSLNHSRSISSGFVFLFFLVVCGCVCVFLHVSVLFCGFGIFLGCYLLSISSGLLFTTHWLTLSPIQEQHNTSKMGNTVNVKKINPFFHTQSGELTIKTATFHLSITISPDRR